MMKNVATYVCALALVLGSVAITGCGGGSSYSVIGTPRAPDADGTITVEAIEGGNRLVKIRLQHVPPPARLGTGLTTFCVWFTANGQAPVKAGLLAFDEGSRTANLMATTPLHNFQLRITAERTTDVASPGEATILERAIQ
jgi:hypothetical protein